MFNTMVMYSYADAVTNILGLMRSLLIVTGAVWGKLCLNYDKVRVFFSVAGEGERM